MVCRRQVLCRRHGPHRRLHPRHGRHQLRCRRRPRRRDPEQAQYEFEWGLPIAVPVVDLTTIGAGGSSIASFDLGRAPQGGARQRGRTARARRLRPGRDGGNGDRREPRARPAQSHSTSSAARSRSTRKRPDTRLRRSPSAWALGRGGSSRGTRHGGREHGWSHPAAVHPTGASITAASTSLRSAGRGRSMRARSCAESASRASSSPRAQAWRRRSGHSQPICGSTGRSRACCVGPRGRLGSPRRARGARTRHRRRARDRRPARRADRCGVRELPVPRPELRAGGGRAARRARRPRAADRASASMRRTSGRTATGSTPWSSSCISVRRRSSGRSRRR